mmetsp:Transcript_11598/g.20837  ORF Transcript_11598/g.20837 Transcript_11598/m.20837 type:complete len:509 (-) Transcript_11598:228-1754(-)
MLLMEPKEEECSAASKTNVVGEDDDIEKSNAAEVDACVDDDSSSSSNVARLPASTAAAAAPTASASSKPAKIPRKFKKAPGAPKRFRSAFILFSQFRHKEIQEELALKGDSEKTTSVAKMVSEEWRNMNQKERFKWEDRARRDRERFENEKVSYQGPWTVPIGHRRSKDPSAPKRPASAFLSFSNSRRAAVKQENKEASNAEISKILSQMWKDAPEDIKKEYKDKEASAREEYKKRMAEWRVENEKAKKLKKDPLTLYEEGQRELEKRGIANIDRSQGNGHPGANKKGDGSSDEEDVGKGDSELRTGAINSGNPILSAYNMAGYSMGGSAMTGSNRSSNMGHTLGMPPTSQYIAQAPLGSAFSPDVLRNQAVQSIQESRTIPLFIGQAPLNSDLRNLEGNAYLSSLPSLSGLPMAGQGGLPYLGYPPYGYPVGIRPGIPLVPVYQQPAGYQPISGRLPNLSVASFLPHQAHMEQFHRQPVEQGTTGPQDGQDSSDESDRGRQDEEGED